MAIVRKRLQYNRKNLKYIRQSNKVLGSVAEGKSLKSIRNLIKQVWNDLTVVRKSAKQVSMHLQLREKDLNTSRRFSNTPEKHSNKLGRVSSYSEKVSATKNLKLKS
jgi:type II secretory pathway component PulC